MAKTRKKRKATPSTRPATESPELRDGEMGPRAFERLKHLSPGYTLTDAEVERALESGERRAQLEPYFGEAAYEELHNLAQKSRRQRRGGPRVLILPGIMGSKLGYPRPLFFDDVIWIDPIEIARGNMADLALPKAGKAVKALGVILFVYLKLKFRLKLQGFDADFHPFDWRLSIDEAGHELKARIDKECGTGSKRREISLVAHSMGGLVSRSAIAQMGGNHEHIRRLVMLGTPNHGSFAPVLVLTGMHDMLRKAAALDLSHDLVELVGKIINTFPGLYQMLPTTQKFNTINLYDASLWPDNGMGPRKDILAKVQEVQASFAPGDPDRMTLIAGVNQKTIVGARVEAGEFQFDESAEGDGTVPLKFAQLDGVKTYFVNEAHGSLPSNRTVISAVIDVLNTGTTQALREDWAPTQRGVTRTLTGRDLDRIPFEGRRGAQLGQSDLRHLIDGFAAPFEPAAEVGTSTPPPSLDVAHTTEPILVGRRRQHRLDIRLAYGSITQVDSEAIILGVYRDVAPSGAATAFDRQMGGAIREFSDRRLLAGNIGEVFIMPVGHRLIPADLLVFAGMGRFDDVNDDVLKLVAENVARTLVHAQVDDFATLLLGSASGTDVRSSMANLIEGFFRGIRDTDRHQIRGITICEIDRARYSQMRTELLQLSATSLFDRFEVTIEEVDLPAPPEMAPPDRGLMLPGPEPAYLYVRKISQRLGENRSAYQTSLLTPGGRATVMSDTQIVDESALEKHLELINDGENFNAATLKSFGLRLAKLMLPDGVAKALAGISEQGPVVIIHDAAASKVPWETLHLNPIPALGHGITRKYEAADLSVAKWLEERRLDAMLNMLLIVNPTSDLPGAKKEGNRVKKLVEDRPAFELDVLEESQATFNAVKSALSSGKYDVVHYAGHAFFESTDRMSSGILCHGHEVFSGAEASKLERLPALMFFNACESGRIRSMRKNEALAAIPKKKVAENIRANVSFAEAFLRGGVGNFVGTYWPVGDDAADAFSGVFYNELIKCKPIGDAVLAGRKAVQETGSVDWANYIHYGSRTFALKQQ